MYLEYWDLSRIEGVSSKEKLNIGYYEYLESFAKDSSFQFCTLLLDESGKVLSQCRLVKRNSIVYIAGLETKSKNRRKGYAKEVLQATIKRAFEQGNNSIHSVVRNWNEASINTHVSLGFSISENKGDNLVLSLNNVKLIIVPIFEEFLDTKLVSCKLISERTDLEDIRFNFEIETETTKYVGKLHSNSFTKVSRIYDTNKLINIYNEIGYSTPKYIESSRYGIAHNYNVFGRNYCLWVEEFKDFETVSEIIQKSPDALKEIEILKINQIPKYIGEIASLTKNLKYNTNSPYRLFQSLDSITAIDEYEVYLNKANKLLESNIYIDMMTLKEVTNRFHSIRQHLKQSYDNLPYAVFQSDLRNENILVDEEYNFQGVIDFNLAGREKVLTYLINELAYRELKSIKELWLEDSYIENHLGIFKDQLKIFMDYYTFNSLEKEMFVDLYKAIIPFKFYPLTDLMNCFKEQDYDEVNYRLKWMKKILDLEIKFV
jgi:hypothetical protein